MDNQITPNPTIPSSVPLKDLKKDPSKKSFLKTPGGIVLIIITVFIILAAVAVVAYNLASNNKQKQADVSTTPTPTPTTSTSPTPSITTTIAPVVTTEAPAASGKFTVETDDKSAADGTPKLEYNIKLNGTLVKNIKDDPLGCKSLLPTPITSLDATKVYYVDPTQQNIVKVMNASKVESTSYTAPSPYTLVTAIQINQKGKFAYTVSDKFVVTCDASYNKPKSAFVIDGKVIPQTNDSTFSETTFENVMSYGDNFFITDWELTGVGVGGGAQSTFIRKVSDASIVKSFSSSGVIYSGKNYAIVTDGYGDVPVTGPEGAKNQNVFKVDLVTGAITYIVSDTMVSNFEIKNGKLIITYGGYYNDNYELVGPTKTLEYTL